MKKFLTAVGAIVFVGLLIFGWVLLVTWVVNFVLAAFGLKPVSALLVWACMFLLGVVGSYFKSTPQKG